MHFSSLLSSVLAVSGIAAASAIPSPFIETRQSSPTAGVVYSKCSKPGVFALAFDDGPGQYTEELIKTLNAAGAKATFFFTGTLYGCIYNRAAAVKAAYSSGHQVASHTWTHPQTLDSMSVAQLTTEMQKLETALVNIIGVKPTYMRPPYLKTGGNVLTAMRNLGYRMITDSIDSQDWNGLSVSASEQKFRSAGPSTPDGKGHISLMHETYATTVRDLVPRLIKWAKENNLKMVTVGRCFETRLQEECINKFSQPSVWAMQMVPMLKALVVVHSSAKREPKAKLAMWSNLPSCSFTGIVSRLSMQHHITLREPLLRQ